MVQDENSDLTVLESFFAKVTFGMSKEDVRDEAEKLGYSLENITEDGKGYLFTKNNSDIVALAFYFTSENSLRMKAATIAEKVNDNREYRSVLEKHKKTYLELARIDFDYVDEIYISPDGRHGVVTFENETLLGDIQISDNGQGKTYVMYELQIK